jgi:hypothetical protein
MKYRRWNTDPIQVTADFSSNQSLSLHQLSNAIQRNVEIGSREGGKKNKNRSFSERHTVAGRPTITNTCGVSSMTARVAHVPLFRSADLLARKNTRVNPLQGNQETQNNLCSDGQRDLMATTFSAAIPPRTLKINSSHHREVSVS